MKIEYSIVSPGTERFGSNGYMSVSELSADGKRYLAPIPHNAEHLIVSADCLEIDSNYSIESIAVARFQMITALALSQINFTKRDRILILGAGPIGVAAYLECKRKCIENVMISTRRIDLIGHYEDNLRFTQQCITFKPTVILECTGENVIIEGNYQNIAHGGSFLLIGTPRKNPTIDLLFVHRNNIKIIGSHELQFSKYLRKKEFNRIMEWHKSALVNLSPYIRFHPNDPALIQKICEHAFFEPFHIIRHII